VACRFYDALDGVAGEQISGVGGYAGRAPGDGLFHRVGVVIIGLLAGAGEGGVGFVGVQPRDTDDLVSGNMLGLCQNHAAEFTCADQAYADGFVGGGARGKQGSQVHGRLLKMRLQLT
jgi:hypothetical protein